jgi:hypothetical protein
VVRPGDDRHGAHRLPGLCHHLGRRPHDSHRFCFCPRRGDLVEPGTEPLGEASGVGEHDRRPVCRDELVNPLLHRRPDRRSPVSIAAFKLLACRLLFVEAGHVLDRHLDGHLDRLGRYRVHHLDRSRPAEEPRDLLERSHRGRQPDSLSWLRQEAIESLERQGEVRPPLRSGDGMDLVHDHRLDAA